MPQKHFVMNSSCFTRFSIFFCCVFTMATVIYKDSSKTSVGNCFAMYTHIASNFLAIKEALLGTCVRGWLSGQLAHFGRKILTRTGRARMKEGLQLASIKKNSLKEFLKVKKTRLNCFPKRLFHFFSLIPLPMPVCSVSFHLLLTLYFYTDVIVSFLIKLCLGSFLSN